MLNECLSQSQKILPARTVSHFVLAEHHLPGQAGNSSSLPVRAGWGCAEMQEKWELWGGLCAFGCDSARWGSLHRYGKLSKPQLVGWSMEI